MHDALFPCSCRSLFRTVPITSETKSFVFLRLAQAECRSPEQPRAASCPESQAGKRDEGQIKLLASESQQCVYFLQVRVHQAQGLRFGMISLLPKFLVPSVVVIPSTFILSMRLVVGDGFPPPLSGLQ